MVDHHDGTDAAPQRPHARLVAHYLPQFHPIPENDEWWGPGFTEWTNVARARRRFPGHRQPRLPGALGFYDLRVPEVREAQAALAAAAGIEAFCYWHYWFGDGRTLLERPFDEVLRSGAPELPFALGWANQSWTGIWHGDPGRVLVEQRYPGEADDEAHFRHLLPAFTDPRAVRIGGRVLFVLQDPLDLPSPRAFTDRWRTLADHEGTGGFHFVGDDPCDGSRPEDHGFDQWTRPVGPHLPHRVHLDGADRVRRAALRRLTGVATAPFAAFTRSYHAAPFAPHEVPVLLTGWDNTPRSGNRGVAFTHQDASSFEPHARATRRAVADRPPDERLVMVKSWNEWAEGNILEPDAREGDAWLRIVDEVFTDG